MLILGVDPGISGALATYDPTTPFRDKPYRLEVIDMPVIGDGTDKRVDAWALFQWLDPAERLVSLAVVERVFAMPSQRVLKSGEHEGERVDMPAYAAMRFGETVATARTVIVCREIPYAQVVSQVWKKESGLSKEKRPDGSVWKPSKEDSRLKAIDTFPEYADLFDRKRDENRAEASLIARFGAFRKGLVPSIRPMTLV